jgi:hypothetical protein
MICFLEILWPGAKQEDINAKFLLFLTDAVAYMLSAGSGLKSTYPELLHVTCLDHGLSRIAEEIRKSFPKVNRLIASVKKVFKKAPSRLNKFKEMFPETPLPPDPIITRWGTWLAAAEYYSEYFEKVNSVVSSLDPDDAAAICEAQALFLDSTLRQNLVNLSANYTFLVKPIAQLQAIRISLDQSLSILAYAVLKRNPDIEKIKGINKIIKNETISNPMTKLSPINTASFKYAPLTTVDVERSFSIHRALYTDRRRKTTSTNLEMELLSHFEL